MRSAFPIPLVCSVTAPLAARGAPQGNRRARRQAIRPMPGHLLHRMRGWHSLARMRQRRKSLAQESCPEVAWRCSPPRRLRRARQPGSLPSKPGKAPLSRKRPECPAAAVRV